MSDSTKRCTKCGEHKPLSDYPPSGHSNCKACRKAATRQWEKSNPEKVKAQRMRSHYRHRDKNLQRMREYRESHLDEEKCRQLRRDFDITLETYDKILEQQNGVCAICGNEEKGKTKKLAVDHCHDTNKVRGLLCQNCNRGIGLLDDNPEVLQKAIDYLLSHGRPSIVGRR